MAEHTLSITMSNDGRVMTGRCECGWHHRINLSSGNVTLQRSMVERLMGLHVAQHNA